MHEITWYIRNSSQILPYMGDEFVEGHLRIMLRGTTLTMRIEGPATIDDAKRLAKSYIELIGRNLVDFLQLLTEEEFGNLPPWASQNDAMALSAHQRSRHAAKDARQAVREARHSVISYAWPLKNCYDYMQDARASEERFFPDIYKMIETMRDHLGGRWDDLRKRTGLANEVDFLKCVANDKPRDERHAPKGLRQPPTGEERAKAHDCAIQILRKFEELCRADGLAGRMT